MSLLESLQKNNKIIYKPLNIDDLKKVCKDLFYTERNYNYSIVVGLVNYYLINWATETIQNNLPKYHIEQYKRLYGIIQITVGSKHSLNKIVVDLNKGEYKYSIRPGGKEIAKTNNLTEAIRYYDK